MKRTTTPVLHNDSDSLYNDSFDIGICLSEVKKLWHVPKSAKKFWFQVIPKPETNSVEVKVKAIGFNLVWSLLENPGLISSPANNFDTSFGLWTLLDKTGLDLTEWTAINVRLLYE